MAPECTFSPRQSGFSPYGATATQQVKVTAVGSSRRWVYVGGSSADSSGSPQVSSPEQLVVRGVLELERDQPHVHLVIHRSPRELATIHRLGISALIRARQAFYVSAGPTVEVHRSPPKPPVADVRVIESYCDDRRGAVRRRNQRAGIVAASASPLPTGKNGSARPCTTSVGRVSSPRRSRHRGVQSSRANTIPS